MLISLHLNDEQLTEILKLADVFQALLEADPPEEEIHRFIDDHCIILGAPRRESYGDLHLQGVESKFPVAPDRIPDFTVFELQPKSMQYTHSDMKFIELKRPSAKLYAEHGRMSKDLNDAWMESQESLRLFQSNYADVIRRLIKNAKNEKPTRFTADNVEPPRPTCSIVIGRRSALDSEALARTRNLSNRDIRIVTYDYILDELRISAERGWLRWLW